MIYIFNIALFGILTVINMIAGESSSTIWSLLVITNIWLAAWNLKLAIEKGKK